MKHCVIRHNHFSKVMSEILELSRQGFKTRWQCSKVKGQWTATSLSPAFRSEQQVSEVLA